MPSFFSKVLGRKDGSAASIKSAKAGPQSFVTPANPPKPKWDDAWQRKDVEPEEVQELLRGCTLELKSRALDLPFLLLPFRPTSDPSAARSFIRNYFNSERDNGSPMGLGQLHQELRLTEPMVLCSVIKWCWSRLPGGVVTWDAYELFRVGEQDSDLARDAFATFIPLSVDSDARTKIIFDFFDLMAAVAAHGKANGLGGRKLSRLAGWWAFEHADSGEGFEGGYKSWAKAADATSHLFFAYLRSLSPNSVRGTNGISALPISLQSLVQDTEYPPETPSLMQSVTSKVVMIVGSVSPTPFALLRRAKHFEYRDEDQALQAFAALDDPVDALTEECRRVLRCISSTNQSESSNSKDSTGLSDPSWSRFEDIGFSSFMDESEREGERDASARAGNRGAGLRATPGSRPNDVGRPTTPSWADFLSAGFVDEPTKGPAPLMLPPDKILPPIDTHRVNSSQSHRRALEAESNLEPGELASITRMDLEDCFWWVWITSLAGEEPTDRKAVFGRCALIETKITGGRWLVMEEKVKGAAPPPEEGAYIVEKKSRFGISKRGKLTRGRASSKKESAPLQPPVQPYRATPGVSKTSIGPDQHARIQAAAAILQKKQQDQGTGQASQVKRSTRDEIPTRTNSVFTLQPVIMNEAAPAMKWANKFDKDAIREAYLGDYSAGKGSQLTLPLADSKPNGSDSTAQPPQNLGSDERQLPAIPNQSTDTEQPPTHPVSVKSPAPALSDPEKTGKDPAEELLHPVERNAPVSSSQAEPEKPPKSPEKIEPAVQQSSASKQSTPEKKGRGNKLKKGGAGGGFKKLFGKKKAEEQTVVDAPQAPEPSSSLQTASQSTLGRLSSFRKKSSQNTSPAPQATPSLPHADDRSSLHREASAVHQDTDVATPAPQEPSSQAHHEPARNVAPEPHRETPQKQTSDVVYTDSMGPVQAYKAQSFAKEPVHSYAHEAMPAQVNQPYHQPTYNQSASKETEEADAARAFSNFSHGPLDDVPAFVPEEDSPKQAESPVQPPAVHEEPTRQVETPPQTETTRPVAAPIAVEKTEPAPADPPREIAPLKDRWAQIRKNAAASRAAGAGPSEGQAVSTTAAPTPPAVSTPAAATTPPAAPAPKAKNVAPEINGEETIESRVARIKARVAELTSNMDNDSAATRPAR